MKIRTHNTETSVGCVLITYLFVLIMWIVNLIKFIRCDFEPGYKEEVIHGIGVFLPPVSVITGWL